MVRVITRGGVGELSEPLVRRTNPSAPGSPPLDLNVVPEVTIQSFNHSKMKSENVNMRMTSILIISDTAGQLCSFLLEPSDTTERQD